MSHAPAERSIGIDLDERAIESFSCGHPVELVHGCTHDFLDAFPFEGRELVYCDPPSLRSTRRSRRRYRFDWSEADHAALLGRLRDLLSVPTCPAKRWSPAIPLPSATRRWTAGGGWRCR